MKRAASSRGKAIQKCLIRSQRLGPHGMERYKERLGSLPELIRKP